jgi:conjugative relaxase-like TrwC/TraI family protein
VQTEDFEAVRQGLAPRTGEFLRQRHSADRIADGTTLAQARHLYDFTISAPKSVSIMAFLGGDERLIAAHEKAVAEAVEELETHAASRVRQDGGNGDRSTRNLILAIITTPAGNLILRSTRTRWPQTLPMMARKGAGRQCRHRVFTNGAPI